MKFSCLKENLLQGVMITGGIAVRASGLPILNNLLFKAEKTGLTLLSTNLEIGIQHTVRGKTETEGECLVPARLLLDLLPQLPEGQLTLEVTQEGLRMSSAKATTTLRTTPTVDFPPLPEVASTIQGIILAREALHRAIEDTVFAAGRVEHRPQFNGVSIAIEGASITFAATDGYRLAEVKLELPKNTTTAHCILPAIAAQELSRITAMADDESTTATLALAENQAKITVGTTIIVTRLIEGDFPDYLPLFPAPGAVAELEARALLRAIKAATIFSRAGTADITLHTCGAEGIAVSSESGSVGTYHTTVPGQCPEGEPVVLNARFLMDGLAVGGQKIRLQIDKSDRPILLTPVDESGAAFRYLIMPIRE